MKEGIPFSTAGTIFLDAPNEIIGHDQKQSTKTTRKRWVINWLARKSSGERDMIDAKALWDQFRAVVRDAAISAVWLQDDKDKVR